MKFTKCMALAIAGAMTMTSMIGCGSSTSSGGSSSSKGKTLTVLTHRTDMDETFKTYAEEFEKTHEG
ncbi:MAG: sugar ABC transporter substrate-binding protein, partial [Clostridium butyricum]|nr:sugar ABC transporter substrate-binding protein [Clostridium butyricum]